MNSNRPGILGEIFLIDTLKRMAADTNFVSNVTEDRVDGKRLTVLNFSLVGSKQVHDRFWIDLRRGGHVIRWESYAIGDALVGRSDIKLASFRVGDKEVWMPVSGAFEGHLAFKGKQPYFTKEPTLTGTIYIVDGTLEFNKHPGPEAFQIQYKAGTPISDNLRKMQYEFGQRKPPTKVEAEAMLREQVAKAEDQGRELHAGSPGDGFPWSSLLVWAFGGGTLVLSIILLFQRGRR